MNQLGFTIKEANGTLVLILILTGIIFIPLIFSQKANKSKDSVESDLIELQKWKTEFTVKKKTGENNEKLSTINYFPFDPNQIDQKQWQQLGIKAPIAQRISNYLQAGGQFRTPNDLYKIYGVDSSAITTLIPYVNIRKETKENKKAKSAAKNVITTEKYTRPVVKTKININKATTKELKQIWGIGERLSDRIIKYRESLGGYISLQQLGEVYYLNDSLLPKIDQLFIFDSIATHTIDINTDSIKVLASHPYIDYNQARAIINYRKVHGTFTRLDEIKKIKIITDSTFHKLKPYLSVKE